MADCDWDNIRRFIQNANRHVSRLSVKKPDTIGPTTDATAVIAIDSDMNIGRSCSGTKYVMIVVPPA